MLTVCLPEETEKGTRMDDRQNTGDDERAKTL